MDRTLNFYYFDLRPILNPNNVTQIHKSLNLSKTFLKKYLFKHAKGKSMAIFNICNAQGQKLKTSESCPYLKLEAKI